MSRLVVVSNRVAPIEEGEATAGGLAAGVLDALRQTGGLWFGWSGEVTDATEPRPERTVGAITLFTIDLSRQDYDEFYRGFANGTLWPVLHYQIGLGRFEWPEFAGYRRVNETFARALSPLLRADDLIWVHDYHLLCLAAALRDLGRDQPRRAVPAHPVSRARRVPDDPVPCRADRGDVRLRPDRIPDRDRSDRLRRLRPARRRRQARPPAGPSDGRITAFGRTVRTGVYPIGVHVAEVRAQAETPLNRRQATRMRASLQELLLLSVDRLDYSKGLRQRFAAFERFLADHPAQHGKVTFMQIAPPSRSDIETYQRIRRELEAEAGRINGRFAEVDWVPLRYLNRSFARNVLMPLYAEAQACLVTPLRDGMNLVAKEYVAAQDPEDPGVLILSEFAGAARELQAALLVNPYEEAGMAQAMDRALSMPVEERQERHQAMLTVMRANSLERWRDRFEADLRAR